MKPVIIELTDAKTKQVVDSLEVDACLVATGRAPYTQARFALLMVSELMSLSCGTSGKLCLLFVCSLSEGERVPRDMIHLSASCWQMGIMCVFVLRAMFMLTVCIDQ